MKKIAVAVLLLSSLIACGSGSDPEDKVITKSPENTKPVAHAGSGQSIAAASLVSLDGSASSDADGDKLTYSWTLQSTPDGSTATLSNAAQISASFTPDLEGSYIAQLIVNDGTVNSQPSTVTIVAASANSIPVANAGPVQHVTTTSLVSLDGSASSDADGNKLTYSWTLQSTPDGSTATLTNAAQVSASFTPDLEGSYIAQLIVNDGTVNSQPSTVTIVAASANSIPVANAGPVQHVTTTSLVSLDGEASSDADGDNLTYSWTLQSTPDGSTASLTNSAQVSASFTSDLDGSYIAQLIVNDGSVDSQPSTVAIVATSANSIPVANAGPDQHVTTTSLVSLNGEASSDADDDDLSYSWSLLSMPEGSSAALTQSSSVSPSFTPDIEGSYIAQLIVNDGSVASQPNTVTIVAASANSIPVANAGENLTLVTGNIVVLDASKSSDADSDALLYQWTFVSKPMSSTASFDNPQLETPSFTPDVDGSYVIGLIVNDGLADSISDNVTIEAIPANVKLYRRSGSIRLGAYEEVSLPFSENRTKTVSVGGIPEPTTHIIETFKLFADGESFTITNVTATNNTSQLAPYFTVIADGYELVEGKTVEFELISPVTNGETISLNFSFEILETGETFSSRYIFTSHKI